MPDVPNIQHIITHSGPFHADDVLACAALRVLYPGASIERTRDGERLRAGLDDETTAVVDVGGVHEPERFAFDHHQPGGAGTRSDGVPFASIGLVWEALGADVVRALLVRHDVEASIDRQSVAAYVDRDFVRAIDAVDCGVASWMMRARDGVAALEPIDIPRLVAMHNPEPAVEAPGDGRRYDDAFEQVVQTATTWLERAVVRAAAEAVADKLLPQQGDDPVVRLERLVPWRGRTLAHQTHVVWPDPVDGGWLAQAIGREDDPMVPKVPYPPGWVGLGADELARVSGVQDAVFARGHVAGARSREGVEAMVTRAREVT